jgi:hypothetical protein
MALAGGLAVARAAARDAYSIIEGREGRGWSLFCIHAMR